MAGDAVYPDPNALAPAAIEGKAARVGYSKANLAPARAFVLAVMAGFFIGMGGMFMLLVKSDATLSFAASSLLGGLAFSVGLCLVLVAGAGLFSNLTACTLGNLVGGVLLVGVSYWFVYGRTLQTSVGEK